MNTIDPNWLSAIAAIVAVGFSLFAHFSAEKSRKRADALEKKNAELAEHQNRLAHVAWSDAYFREITAWACQVSTAISQAIHIVDEPSKARRQDTLITLSACVDMGRWYFPNRHHDQRGTHKEPAYRGIRQEVLDWIVEAYNICERPDGYPHPRTALVRCQRNFVSFIQEFLDPRSREQAIERVLCDFGPVSSLPKISSPPEQE